MACCCCEYPKTIKVPAEVFRVNRHGFNSGYLREDILEVELCAECAKKKVSELTQELQESQAIVAKITDVLNKIGDVSNLNREVATVSELHRFFFEDSSIAPLGWRKKEAVIRSGSFRKPTVMLVEQKFDPAVTTGLVKVSNGIVGLALSGVHQKISLSVYNALKALRETFDYKIKVCSLYNYYSVCNIELFLDSEAFLKARAKDEDNIALDLFKDEAELIALQKLLGSKLTLRAVKKFWNRKNWIGEKK